MDNQNERQQEPSGGTQQTVRLEMICIFGQTLTDIYKVKKHLLKYIPVMTNEVQSLSLRYAILDTGVDIHAQLLRMDMVIAILKNIKKK